MLALLMAVEPTAAAESIASLVRAAGRGDQAAFTQLHHHYARTVQGILLARVPREDAADLTQEVFLQAWRSLRSLRAPEAFGSWLVQIARRRAISHLRRRAALSSLPAELQAPAPPREEAREALEAIRRLPEAYREPLVLRLVEGLSGPEIAARTGLTPGSVRVNLHRGFSLLREALAEESAP